MAKSRAFDPYHVWLGIPPEEQPPSAYRLLGLRNFESDADVISNAADQRMAHVRAAQTGEHRDKAEAILNEMSRARLVLLDPNKKHGYDAHLGREASRAGGGEQKLASPAAVPGVQPSNSGPLPMSKPQSATADSVAGGGVSKPNARNEKAKPALPVALILALVFGGGALVFVLLLGAIGMWWLWSDSVEIVHREETASQDIVSPPPPPPPVTFEEPVDEPRPIDSTRPTDPIVRNDPPVAVPTTPPSPPVPVVDPAEEIKPEPPPTTTVSPEDSGTPVRTAVPSQAEQAPVLAKLDELYPPEETKSNEERLRLAGDFLRMGSNPAAPEVERFVLLRRASEFAAQGGDPALMSQAVARLGEKFELDPLKVEAALLTRMAQKGFYQGNAQVFVNHTAEFADDAMISDRFDVVQQVLAAVLTLPSSLIGVAQRNDLQVSLNESKTQAELYAAVQESTRVVADDDKDGDAHLVLARWYCFGKGDWETGMLHLAKSSHPQLQAIAAAELVADTATAAGKMAAGDQWWNAASDVEQELQQHVYGRAAFWYRQINAASLSGLDRVALQKRLTEYDEQFGATASAAVSAESEDRYIALFGKAMTAVQERRFGDADRYFSHCLRMQPNSSEAIANYALSGLRLGHSQRAVKQWKRLVDGGVDAPELMQNMQRCRTLVQAGEIPLDRSSISDLDTIIGLAVRQVATYGRYDSRQGFLYVVVNDAGRQAPWEDRGCMLCDGDGKVDCPVKGCSNGKVRVTRTGVVATNPITGQPITNTTTVSVGCQYCRAQGNVECRACDGDGVDERLSSN